jgi:hypothetical protein
MVNKNIEHPKFDPKIYSRIILNDLVVYSIYYLHHQGLEITSEDVISACFNLFPKRFALRKYPQWPDSAIVSRRWSDCKSRGYLRGDAIRGFQITAKGIKRAEKVEKSLGEVMKPVPMPKPKVEKTVAVVEKIRPELKVQARKYIRSIELSDAYKRYKKQMSLNEFDFRSLLLCTMESPPATLARNLEQFKGYVNIHERKDLLSFLEYCGEKFAHMLGTTNPTEKKVTRK